MKTAGKYSIKAKYLKRIVICVVLVLLPQLYVAVNSTPFTNVQNSSTTTVAQPNQTNIVALSIIIDEASYFDQLAAWLRALNFKNFTFVVVEGATNDYILKNVTRLSVLEQYGKIIPRLSYSQGYEPDNRILNANFTLNEFTEALGYTPKGVMDFIPDTYTSQYLLTRGVEYYQGYCFDQYNIDLMTMRGGFQMPYYANASNVLCPSRSTGGMVILPHSTWDWVASFTVSHNIQLHPVTLMNLKFDGGKSAVKSYFLEMIDETFAGSSPFGYVTVQFEWSWCCRDADTSQVLDWIRTLLSTRPSYNYWTFEEAANWFKANYDQTPTYRIEFTSPYDGEQIEWYYSLSSRVARMGNDVVSYVDYTDQQPDKYLNSYTPLSWKPSSNLPTVIDNSLQFKVDALGGGYLRAPVATSTFPYGGDLQFFSENFTETSLSEIDSTLLKLILSLVVLFIVGAIVVVLAKTKGKFSFLNRRKPDMPSFSVYPER
jgi:hypothetical protein